MILVPFSVSLFFGGEREEEGEVLKAFINMCHPLLFIPASGVLYSQPSSFSFEVFFYIFILSVCLILVCFLKKDILDKKQIT